MRRRTIVLGLIALAGAATVARGQTTWYVDDNNCPGPGSGTADNPFCSIQQAILVAGLGDEIIVATGTYHDQLNLLGKSLTLRSTDPTNPSIVAATVIDATGFAGSTVVCALGEGPDTVVNGFKITGGTGTLVDGYLSGGGLYAGGSSPTILNCWFTGNTADRGGGMCTLNGSPFIKSCMFTDNEVEWCGADCDGGGLYIEGGTPMIEDTDFVNNDIGIDAWGGGLYAEFAGPIVRRCNFNGNFADSGGGMGLVGGSPRVIDCDFSGNEGGLWGGGGIRMQNGSLTLLNSRFQANHAEGSQGDGGGIRMSGGTANVIGCRFHGNTASFTGGAILCSTGTLNVVNTIMDDNSADGGGGMWISGGTVSVVNSMVWDNSGFTAGGGIYGTSSTSIANSIIWANFSGFDPQIGGPVSVSYSDVQGGWGGPGNINVNPQCANAAGGDFELLASSPCIDAGNNAAVPADVADVDGDGNTAEPIPFDYDGSSRFVDAPTPDTGVAGNGHSEVVDMGPHEFVPPCAADLDGDAMVDVDDLLALLGAWGPCPGCAADITGDNVVDVNDLLALLGSWGPCV